MWGIFIADIYFLWAVDARKKKNQNKKIGNWDYFEKSKNHLNLFPTEVELGMNAEQFLQDFLLW